MVLIRWMVLCLLLGLGACSGERDPRGEGLEAALGASWADLDYEVVTRMPEGKQGGRAIVFLHGYGGSAANASGLAQALLADNTRILLPTAVLTHPSGEGAIWWEFFDEDWPRPYTRDPSIEWPPPSRQLPRARQAVLALIAKIRARYRPDQLALVGHSQGAMLALDVAALASPPLDRLALVSGYLLADSLPSLAAALPPRPLIFVAHGRKDTVVDPGYSDEMRRVLQENEFEVRSLLHAGGHSIDERVVAELREFLLQ